MASEITTELHVFDGVDAVGGCQSVTLIDCRDQLQSFVPPNMRKNVDYSIVYLVNDVAYVVWRNHQGVVQFCGSGAYALSLYIFEHTALTSLAIQSQHIHLAATYKDGLCLHIPLSVNEPTFIKALPVGDVYHHADSGIYFIQLPSSDVLKSAEWNVDTILTLPLHDPHAVCLYYWNDKQSTGFLRYFTPWHGRDEDVVTGSVQRYLTPLVYKQFGASRQHWYQCSQGGGRLQTYYAGSEVQLMAQPV